MKVLLCGHRSMASHGLIESLSSQKNVEVDCFSRGSVRREGNIVTGDVFNMMDNPYLSDMYDVVVNFIIIENGFSIEKNIEYLRSLVSFCSTHAVKKLIHISTISVYPNSASYVNESSEIEKSIIKKGVYASMKMECDKYLMKLNITDFKVVFVRPGYVVTRGESIRWGGIMIALPFNRGILLGDKMTSLPLIERSIMIEAITRIVINEYPLNVFLLLKNNRGTKYEYIKKYTTKRVFTLSRLLVVGIAKLLRLVRFISMNKYYQILGLFKNTYFDSSKTETLLNLKF